MFGRAAEVRVAFLTAQAPQLPAREPVFLVAEEHPQPRGGNHDDHRYGYHHQCRHIGTICCREPLVRAGDLTKQRQIRGGAGRVAAAQTGQK